MIDFFDRLDKYMKYKGLNDNKITVSTGISNGLIGKGRKRGAISQENISKILQTYSEIDANWLLTGEGEMLKGNNTNAGRQRKKIPVYDAVSIGGTNGLQANMDGIAQPAGWIDAGDWFLEATSAIHHYGDSMLEYPSGCILALRDIYDMQKTVWGKNYVIETTEYRITKRLQKGRSEGFIRAYSTNEETYQDGTLIHEPIDIEINDIRRMALVLGYVVKEQSSGMMYRVKKND
jgi:hypothetical protein